MNLGICLFIHNLLSALHNLYEEIEESYIKKDKLIVGIDTMDGFAWPWMWYLREYKNVVWINELNIDNHDYDYLLINQKNFEKLSSESLSNYKFKRIIAHRKWFRKAYIEINQHQMSLRL